MKGEARDQRERAEGFSDRAVAEAVLGVLRGANAVAQESVLSWRMKGEAATE